jgi:hypothetical protein
MSWAYEARYVRVQLEVPLGAVEYEPSGQAAAEHTPRSVHRGASTLTQAANQTRTCAAVAGAGAKRASSTH